MPAKLVSVRLYAIVLAGLIAATRLASGEHVHEVEEHGHLEVVVHRHLQSHGVTVAHHDEKTLDHPDETATALDEDYTVPPGLSVAAPPSGGEVAILEPPVVIRCAHVEFVERVIHGPPRAPTPERGPPSSSHLM